MAFKRSLSRRIVIAFTVMAVSVAGIFATGIVVAVFVVEESLISKDLGGELDGLLLMDSVDEWRPQPMWGQQFSYTGGRGEFAVAADLEALDPGFHEVYRGDSSYHAMVRDVDGRRYYLLQDQSEFESREEALFMVVLVGWLLSSVLAGFLGWLLARKVIEPLSRLARQVIGREQLLDFAPPLASDYGDDEVGQLAAAFDDALGRLREALARERLFTSDVSHELRTPLMIISSSCELLQEGALLDARGLDQLQRISRATEEMSDLTQTFLLLARAEHGRAQLSPTLALETVADELVALWRAPIEAKGLTLHYHRAKVPGLEFHGPFLRTVMSNLLRNAMHYTQQGSISLTLNQQGFVVEDTGVGIPLSEQETVFQPFVRGSTQIEGGKGVGLSLVKRICVVEGWRINLQSTLPQGCRFEVCLQEANTSFTGDSVGSDFL